MMKNILLLAGGKSSRMNGQNKAYLPIKDTCFLEYLLQAFSLFPMVLLSTREELPYKDVNVAKVIDEVAGIGPLSGILSAFHQYDVDSLFVTACDMPRITATLVNRFYELLEDYDGVFLKEEGRLYPLGGLYCKNMVAQLEDGLYNKDYSLAHAIRASHVRYVTLQDLRIDADVYTNVNTEEEYRQLFDN